MRIVRHFAVAVALIVGASTYSVPSFANTYDQTPTRTTWRGSKYNTYYRAQIRQDIFAGRYLGARPYGAGVAYPYAGYRYRVRPAYPYAGYRYGVRRPAYRYGAGYRCGYYGCGARY